MTLKADLDKMTQLAAEEEKCESECKEFNDVIIFDQNKDVSYIPSMLQGCPPMAPTSPEFNKVPRQRMYFHFKVSGTSGNLVECHTSRRLHFQL